MTNRTAAERQAIARDAAERVARNTGAPAQLCYAPVLRALEDADRGPITWSTGRLYAECVVIVLAVLFGAGLLLWCWP